MRRLVYWNAFVLNDGESLDDNVPPHYRALSAQMAAASADNSVMMPFPIWPSRLRLFRLVQILGNHELMFTAPPRLAAAGRGTVA